MQRFLRSDSAAVLLFQGDLITCYLPLLSGSGLGSPHLTSAGLTTGVCWCPEPRHEKTLPAREADRGQGSEIREVKSQGEALVRGWVSI